MNRMLIVFLVLVSCSLALAADGDRKCQQSGEYCQNHWDCCSNTCLSFLYKCSNILSSDIKPSAVISNRVGLVEEVPLSSPVEIVSYESLLEFIFNPLKSQPTAVGRELNSIIPRLDVDEVQGKKEEEVITSTTDAPPPCLEIGAKCYANEECCSKRCHGYLHQCVT